MLPSLRLGRILQIETTIHWTFWILILWVLLNAGLGAGLQSGFVALGFLLTVFGCVYLHELGHAFAAAQFGIRTIDITMLPIGGVARLERIPTSAKQELWIALAGPAVNIVIAMVLGIGLSTQLDWGHLHDQSPLQQSFMAQILVVNLGLAIFNMIPALPMDGGRVLRGILQFWWSRLQATEIAVRVSRYIAIAFIVLGLYKGMMTLGFIGVFVLIAGFQELMSVRFSAWKEAAANGNPSGFGPIPGVVWSQSFEFPFRRNPNGTSATSNDWDDDDVIEGEVLDADDVRRIE
jgi:Zn-dependent protease